MENNLTEFYTQKGYDLANPEDITIAMEDYLEMICRQGGANGIHVRDLAKLLHVKPSSASKMAAQLKELGYVQKESYGRVFLTEKGIRKGEYLLFRHRIVYDFLCWINHSAEELYETERLEHYVSAKTVMNMQKILVKNTLSSR